MGSKPPSPTGSKSSRTSVKGESVGKKGMLQEEDMSIDWDVRPEFIYGGPFIKPPTKPPFMDGNTPINIQLQGTFKKSFAYYSLKERLPVILTKVIDYCSREGAKIAAANGGKPDSVTEYIKYVTKLKNDLVTNKNYDLFSEDSKDAKKWNSWIQAQDQTTYFTNAWVFSECYVYRRLREGVVLAGLNNFDPFDQQKRKSFFDNLEPMCMAADKVVTMLEISEKDKRKVDFGLLLKLCLWSNKCDLSLTAGSAINLSGKKGEIESNAPLIDPFQMILDLKDKVIVDDSNKIADGVVAKSETIKKNMANAANAPFKQQCSCARLATLAGMQKFEKPADYEPPAPPPPPPVAEGEEPPPPEKIPCPAKLCVPQQVMFDIICDNAGYEIFTDFCLATFLISQEIVKKVRFHVKKIPWFVSDVTLKDFVDTIDWCASADYSRTVTIEPKPGAEGDEAEPQSRTISAANLRSLGEKWGAYVQDGTFELLAEDYWTWPHVYKDMKRIDYNLYRKLQLSCGLLFKGDLNYRKLLGERKCNPYLGFEASLQGFVPAPIIAVRTVKSELISGMPKNKLEFYNKIDPKWMETGNFGTIQWCKKGEALKVSAVPCIDYGTTCFSGACPKHTDM